MDILFENYFVAVALLFGLCFFSIFKKSILIFLAIICVAVGMIFSEAYGLWIDLALGLMIIWGLINILRGEGK